ncbi:MAG: hypothetical protein K9L74_01955 [Candidatus Izimaplasma sp.]|nr:hypothetical protein [Candidatus Izimaplasma bacterium]
MKKGILIAIFTVFVALATWFYISNKLPDNYIGNIEGQYKNSSVLNIFEYQDETALILRSYETTYDAWDDDDCVDDMLMIAILDQANNLLETIDINETLTLDNDGSGIRSGEIVVESIQSDNIIYASIALYEARYILEFDIINRTYQIYDVEYYLKDIQYIDGDLRGITVMENESLTDIYLTYYVLGNLSVNRTKIGSMITESDYPMNHWNMALYTNYILINGDINGGNYSYEMVSVYNIETTEVSLIQDDDVYYYAFWEQEDNVYYAALFEDNFTRIIYNIDGTEFDISNLDIEDKETFGEVVSDTYIHISTDDDFYNNRIRLYDVRNEKEVVLEFDERTYLNSMYESEDKLYLVIGNRQGILSQIVNGSSEQWVVVYEKVTLENIE